MGDGGVRVGGVDADGVLQSGAVCRDILTEDGRQRPVGAARDQERQEENRRG